MESSENASKELRALLNSNVAMLNDLMKLVDDLLSRSTGEEDTVALCSLRQHEQYTALSGLKRLRSQCLSEKTYHNKLSSGEVPLDPYVKSTNAAHLGAVFRFLKLCNPDDEVHNRILAGVLQAIHFKHSSDQQLKPSWSASEFDDNIKFEPSDEDCAYTSEGEDVITGELNAFGMAENVLVENSEPSESERPPLIIDVQAFSGHIWIKTMARNPKALDRAARGEGEYGEKTMLKYASEFTEASWLRPIHHRNPFMIFFFEFGLHTSSPNSSPEPLSVTEDFPVVADQLLAAGILPAVSIDRQGHGGCKDMLIVKEAAKKVKICSFCRLTLYDVFEHLLFNAGAVPLFPSKEIGNDIETAVEWLRSRFGESVVAPPSIMHELTSLQEVDIKNGVNIDVSTLLVLASNLTNGKCDDSLFASNRHRALREQAANERKRPVIAEQLAPFFAKRPNIQLYCCETALKSFMDIVKILAGAHEKGRAEALVKRLIILPDVLSSRVADLPESVNVKPRAKVIFGFGDAYRLVTVTANAAFVRAALYHAGGVLGHQLAVYLHPSRALSEQKEEVVSPGPDQEYEFDVFSNPDHWVERLLSGKLKSEK